MVEDSKKDEKPEGSAKRPDEGAKDKPGAKPDAPSAGPAGAKPGETAKEPAKPAAAKDADKKTAPSVPTAGAKPDAPPPPFGAGAKPGAPPPPPPGGAKPAATPKGKARGGCLGAIFWLVAALVVVAVAGYFTWPKWAPYVEAYLPTAAPAEDPRLTELEGRVAEIERKLAAPRPEIEAIRSLQADRQQINERLSSAQKEVESLQKAIASVGQMAELVKGADSGEAQRIVTTLTLRIDELNQALLRAVDRSEQDAARLAERIDELQAKLTATDAGASEATAAALAAGQLAQALKASGPFSAELNAVKGFVRDDAEMAAAVAALEPYAAGGVPTVAELRGRFPAVADAVVRADAAVQGDGWVGSALNRVRSLVTIRRTGEAAVAAGGVDGALARAEGALAAGDLAAAIQALETLEPPAAAAAGPWLADARSRLAAERLLSALQAGAISRLSAKG